MKRLVNIAFWCFVALAASPAAAQSAGYEEAVDDAMRLREEGRHALAAIAFTNVHDLDADNELAYRYLLEAAREWNRVPGHEVEVLGLLERVLGMTEDPQGPARRAMRRHRAEAVELREQVLAAIPPERLQARDNARRALAEATAHERAGRLALAGQSYGELYDVMQSAGFSRASVAMWNRGRVLGRIPGQEEEATAALRRFLDESTLLETAVDVRGWRSNAVALIQELELRAPTTAPARAELDTPGGQGGVEAGQAAGSEEESRGGFPPVGPIVMGVGGAALVAGIVVGAISLGQDSEFQGACDDLAMCPTALRPQYDEMRAVSAAADVMLVTGGAVAALGLVLTLVLEGDEDEPVAAAVCTEQGCVGGVRGRF